MTLKADCVVLRPRTHRGVKGINSTCVESLARVGAVGIVWAFGAVGILTLKT